MLQNDSEVTGMKTEHDVPNVKYNSSLKSPQIYEDNQDFSNTVTHSDHGNYQQKEKVKIISKHDHQQKLYKEVNRSLEHQSLSKFTKTSKVNPRLKRTDSYS